MISVLILTYNEAVNIGPCLESIPWRDDVHVLDSGSSDGTPALAEAAGATVHERPFDDYARQRNFGLGLTFRHPWVLMLDADERMTPVLAAEIATVLKQPDAGSDGGLCLLRVRRQDMFMGRWIRRASGYPTWFPRLFRVGHVTVERSVNEAYVTEGSFGHLDGHIVHHPFAKGLDWWIDRHNRYSTMEADVLARERADQPVRRGELVSADPVQRRAALKRLIYRLPGRPLLMFLGLYLWRRGFLDGRAGFHYCMLRAFYEYMIEIKMKTGGAHVAHDIVNGPSGAERVAPDRSEPCRRAGHFAGRI